MNVKRFRWLTLALIAAVIAGASLGCAGSPDAPSPGGDTAEGLGTHRIGVVLPLTGPIAWLGEHTRDGVSLGAEFVNSRAAEYGFDVELVFGDSRGDPSEAVTLANRFLNVDRVHSLMVLGTAPVNAVLPIADRQNVLLFGFTIHPGIAGKSPNLFRIYVSDDQEWELLATHVNGSSMRRLGVLHINAEYGLDSLAALQRHLAPEVEIVYAEPYPIGASDFRSILTRIRGQAVDGIVLMGYGSEYVALLGQMKEMRIDTPILGNVDFTFDFVRELPEAEGAIFTAPAFSFGDHTEASRAFVDAFQAAYEGEPAWDVAYSYDAVLILAEALRQAQSFGTDEVRAQLLGVSAFPGAAGQISIDADGDGLSAIHLATLEDGAVIPLDEP